MTASNEEACEILRDICDGGKLKHTIDVCKQEDVVMHQNGSLAYANGDTQKNQTNRKRKELVLGLNGRDSHTLAEANSLLDKPIPASD